jgi:hypothetical protein
MVGKQVRLVQEVGEEGAEFLELFRADGVEVAQARGRRGDAVAEAKEPPPADAVLAGEEFGKRQPATVELAAQADAEKE